MLEAAPFAAGLTSSNPPMEGGPLVNAGEALLLLLLLPLLPKSSLRKSGS